MKDKINQYFANASKSNKEYVITEYDDGSWACSCPAWIFHKGERVNCKHINQIICRRNNEVTINVSGLSNSQDSNKQEVRNILPQRNSESFSCENNQK